MNILTITGMFISVSAATLQLISDIQMHRFRKSIHDKSAIIRVGPWKNSRHPNYLGEIMMWWGVFIAMVSVLSQYWFLIFGAIVNTFFLYLN